MSCLNSEQMCKKIESMERDYRHRVRFKVTLFTVFSGISAVKLFYKILREDALLSGKIDNRVTLSEMC